jgi:hypothetical protein
MLQTREGSGQSIFSWNSKDGEIKALYWPNQNKSDLWAHLVPSDSEGGLRPATAFIFYVNYPGQILLAAPSVVHVYMESDLGIAPLKARRPVLIFRLDDGSILDLTLPDRQFTLHTTGSDPPQRGWIFGVTADLTPEEFLKLAGARQVKGNALGLEFTLTPANLKQLGEFCRRLRLEDR